MLFEDYLNYITLIEILAQDINLKRLIMVSLKLIIAYETLFDENKKYLYDRVGI